MFSGNVVFRLMIFSFTLALGLGSYGRYYSEYPDSLENLDEDTPGEGTFDSTDSEIYDSDNIYTYFESTLHENREALDVLFGSSAKAQSLVVDKVLIHTNYWLMDEALHAIEKELHQNSKINEEMNRQIKDIVLAIMSEMSNWSNVPSFDADFFNQLNQSKKIMDLIMGRHARNDYYSDIHRSFMLGKWHCKKVIPSLWRELVRNQSYNENVTLTIAMRELLEIIQAAKRNQNVKIERHENFLKIKLEYLLILSQQRNKELIESLLCNDTDDCEVFNEALCDPDMFKGMSKITKVLQNKLNTTDVKPDVIDLEIILDITKGFGSIGKELSKIPDVRRSGDARYHANRLFVYYLGIVNVAFGYNSTASWKRTTVSNALSRFQQILVENEEYVGFTADMVLGEDQNEDFDESTLSVQMRRVRDDSSRVEFNFGNVQIWTEDLSATNASNENVYSLYYKSWNDILRNITEGYERNKTILGKGGVVSLSRKINHEKKSLSVYYRIGIDDDSVFRNDRGELARRCLSCGYYDVVSQDWKTNGCHVSSVNQKSVTCRCNHTTNFAAFMSPYKNEYDLTDSQDLWLNVFEYVGSVTSAVGLTLSFIAFYVVRNAVRNDRLRAHMNLTAALLFVHVIQIGAEFAAYDDKLCTATTLATHYFLLASFMWMLIEGFFLYFYVVKVFVRSRTESRKWMYITGWLVPLVIVAASGGYGLYTGSYISPNTKTYKSSCNHGEMLYPPIKEPKYSVCWLNSMSGMTWTFVGPAIAVVLINLVILCKVVVALAKLSERSKGLGKLQGPEQQAENSKEELPKGTPKLVSIKTRNYEVQPDGRISWVNPELSKQPRGILDYYQQYFENNPVLSFNSNRRRYLKEMKKTVKGAVVLLPLLGISWIFGLFAYKSYALSLIFVLLNSIQGVAIFLIYCVLNNEVYRALQRRISTFCLGRKDTIVRRRSISSGSVKSVLSKSMLKNWTRRSTTTPVFRSNNPA